MFGIMVRIFQYAEMCEKLYNLDTSILRSHILKGKCCWRISNVYLFLLQVQEVIKYHCHLRETPSALRGRKGNQVVKKGFSFGKPEDQPKRSMKDRSLVVLLHPDHLM